MISKPKTIYGIHDVTLYHIATGIPYGVLRVLGGSTLTLSGEVSTLTGGSSAYDWDSQDGPMAAELKIKPKEFPDFMFQVFLGADPTVTLSGTGNVGEFQNVLGSSVFDTLSGIAEVNIVPGSENDLKYGKYFIQAKTPTSVDIIGTTSIDYGKPNPLVYLSDNLRVNEEPLTIVPAGDTNIPNLGVTMTGGFTEPPEITMIPGDTASFFVTPPSESQTDMVIGELGACVPEFGAIATAQKQSDGTMWIIDVYRVKALGFPLGMEEKTYAEAEITGKCTYSTERNGVFSLTRIRPSNGCS